MFSPRLSVPSRRVSRLASRSHARTQNFQPLLRQQLQLRPYAMLGPSLSMRRRNRPTQDSLIFKQQDLPSLDFWQGYVSRTQPKGLTAEVLLGAATRYCEVATNGSSAWQGKLEKEYNIDAYTLHYTAVALAPLAGRISMHMLLTASNLGYAPSTLSLMRLVVEGPKYGTTTSSTLLRDVQARFKRLLQTSGDPDALTVQGLAFLRQGDDAAALRYFDRAVAAGSKGNIQTATDDPQSDMGDMASTRKSRWWYESICQEKRGLILLRQGRREEAAAAFRIAALELGLREGYLELGKLLPQGTPERETYLLMAAQAGNFEACQCLALDAADKATEPGLPQAEREDAANMAYEWAWLEPDADKRGKLVSLIVDKLKDVVKARSIS
ncbi:hypothetical protein MFIFM68171_10431 [Madurella fahalii]|uniref:Uncharacterized protein n=1 Tax=Madurella fahalii TaxID=1157608 RepID=A0ABQ0GR59_9PEZI